MWCLVTCHRRATSVPDLTQELLYKLGACSTFSLVRYTRGVRKASEGWALTHAARLLANTPLLPQGCADKAFSQGNSRGSGRTLKREIFLYELERVPSSSLA